MTCEICLVPTDYERIKATSKLVAKNSSVLGPINHKNDSVFKIRANTQFIANGATRLRFFGGVRLRENSNLSPISRLGGLNSDLKSISILDGTLRSRNGSSSKYSIKYADKFFGSAGFIATQKLFPSGFAQFSTKYDNSPVDVKITNFENLITENGNSILLENYDYLSTEYPVRHDGAVDEGVFIGDYTSNRNNGYLITDDEVSYVFPNNLLVSGDIVYKFSVSKPNLIAKQSYFAIRAFAPYSNYMERKPQYYKIYDVKFQDPSGNLIISYNDINIKPDTGYTTYISDTKTNNLVSSYQWQNSYPLINQPSGYTLSFSISAKCEQSPFSEKFDEGYEDTCLSTYPQFNPLIDPLNYLKISAVEVGNSGTENLAIESFLPIYQLSSYTPRTISRVLGPSEIMLYQYDNGIYPTKNSKWIAFDEEENRYENTTLEHANILVNKIRTDSRDQFIMLSGLADSYPSGKLVVKFNTLPFIDAKGFVGGAFDFGGNNPAFNNAAYELLKNNDEYFNVTSVELKVIASKINSSIPDYVIDVVGYSDDKLLNVTKKIGGFLQNDDTISYKIQDIPKISGFYDIDDLSMSFDAISNKSQYYEKDITSLGDHYTIQDIDVYKPNTTILNQIKTTTKNLSEYKVITNSKHQVQFSKYSKEFAKEISENALIQSKNNVLDKARTIFAQEELKYTYPTLESDIFKLIDTVTVSNSNNLTSIEKSNIADVFYGVAWLMCPRVTGVQFQEYTFPLKIYNEQNYFGYDTISYTSASMFENLYVDISPLPTGAKICSIKLIVNYTPSNALSMITIGGDQSREMTKREFTLMPSNYNSASDRKHNHGLGYSTQLSKIENIPHGYLNYPTLKTNYSRRWRGVTGSITNGPFSAAEFDYSFYNPEIERPFLSGYFNFNYDSGSNIFSLPLGSGLGSLSGKYVGNCEKYQNLGLRFKNNNIFTNQLVGYTGNYSSLDWTLLSSGSNNFIGHPLYGKICDAYDNAVRVSGANAHLDFGNVNTNNGFAFYIRFTPDYHSNDFFFNSGILVSQINSQKTNGFYLGYENGYLCAYLINNGTISKAKDSLPYYEYQYPLSAIVTFREFGSPSPSLANRITLYTDNEIKTEIFNHARGAAITNTSTGFNPSGNKLLIGHSNIGSGMKMFVHEFGISTTSTKNHPIANSLYGNQTNITNNIPAQIYYPGPEKYVPSANRDSVYKYFSISKFFETIRQKFWTDADENNDGYKLWSFVDNNIDDWRLGAFRTCSFSPAFDVWTVRVGSDYITHELNHHGSGYSQFTNKSLPDDVNLSGVCYHTQIENDFLRFNIADLDSDDANRFYRVPQRIVKNLPRGYGFRDGGISVQTTLEYESSGNVIWNDKKLGPKLIVSLYTPSQNHPFKPNQDFGLVTRQTHYLEPSGCIRTIETVFNQNSIFDYSEGWSSFESEAIAREFNDRYLNTDINSMFLQYDIVYPSGQPFKSKVKIHNANIKCQALVVGSGKNTTMNMYSMSKKYSFDTITLFNSGINFVPFSGVTLYTSGSKWPRHDANVDFYTSGSTWSDSVNLFTSAFATIDVFSGPQLFGSFDSAPRPLTFYVSGAPMREISMPLYANGETDILFESLSLTSFTDITPESQIPLYIRGLQLVDNRYISGSMPLFTNSPYVYQSGNASMNLVTAAIQENLLTQTCSLYTINYLTYESADPVMASIRWDKNNVGDGITSFDNSYATIDVDDDIRGVSLICRGICEDGNNARCEEDFVTIHGIDWYEPEVCVDGGIFRPQYTYTNLSLPSGAFKSTKTNNIGQTVTTFDTDLMYSGHFYGIRKYSGLIPNYPYVVTVVGRYGSKDFVEVPSEFTEIEYNSIANTDTFFNNSGIKIIPPTNYIASGDEFGKAIASKDNILIVGAPKRDLVITDSNEIGGTKTLQEAGSVFIYRREDRPTGYSWPTDKHKSPWQLSGILTLPNEMLRDYSVIVESNDFVDSLPDGFNILKTYWNVGQEGRQFGHSLDLAIDSGRKSLGHDSRNIIVVGGPSAKWTRSLSFTEPDTVNIGVMLFTDEFSYRLPGRYPNSYKGYEEVVAEITNKDLVYKYFSTPSVKFDVKLMILQPIADDPNLSPSEFPDKPDFITLSTISRNRGKVPSEEKINQIFSGIQSSFLTAFPYDENKVHNNIPPLLSICIDNSASLSGALDPALSRFVDYYKKYSYASGVKTLDTDMPSSGEAIVFTSEFGQDEDWIELSKGALNKILDFNFINEVNGKRFISNNVGSFNSSANPSFTIPPESGGRVYIFEQESGSWNLIQEIRSPNVTYSHPDRFGHAVTISDDTDVIAVGSPYINDAVTVYEYKPDSKIYLYLNIPYWVQSKQPKYSTELQQYLQSPGRIEDAEKLYLSLSPEDKFRVRLDYDIKEYEQVYKYTYQDNAPIGAWTFINSLAAPTPRLGYSLDLNEDGTKLIVGSPTDSMNLSNDADIYYTCMCEKFIKGRQKKFRPQYRDGSIKPTWPATVNAGSVKIFESRKYYPHSGVIEYGKFGNLHEMISMSNKTADSGHFDYVKDVFADKHFVKTDFDDPEIPQGVGLMFIVTPSANALSNEVFDKISNWLALGDRNLVLVGNDPIWEADGQYSKSNKILNNLLERLNSRMRLVQARNRYESLPNGYSSFNNIVPSFVPFGCTDTYVARTNLRGSGVADIKIYYPNFFEQMRCAKVTDCSDPPEKIQIQSRCEMPLQHYGDIRAEWKDLCCKPTPKGFVTIIYSYNWPLIFGSYVPDCGYDTPPPPKPTKNQEPIPLLVAAEKTMQTITIPEIPEKTISIPIIEKRTDSNERGEFGGRAKPELDFIWDSGNSDYSSLQYNFAYNLDAEAVFYKPQDFDGKGYVLQAKAVSRVKIDPYSEEEEVSPRGYYCVEEPYYENDTSTIVLLGINSESKQFIYDSYLDQNVNFYVNLVSHIDTKTKQRVYSTVAQIGGENQWPNRTSFIDAYPKSILYGVLGGNNDVIQGFPTKDLHDSIDVAWIANPLNDITSPEYADELQAIKLWLKGNSRTTSLNKKLVITYDQNISSIKNIEKLLTALNVQMKPIYLNYLDKYASVQDFSLGLNSDSYISKFRPFVSFGESQDPIMNGRIDFTPIKLGPSSIPLAYSYSPVNDLVPKIAVNDFWEMRTGFCKVSFPVVACSGYELYFKTLQETPTERVPLYIVIENVFRTPRHPCPDTSFPEQSSLSYINDNGDYINGETLTPAFAFVLPADTEETLQVQVAENVSEINIYIGCNTRYTNSLNLVSEPRPRTTRLVGISGAMISTRNVVGFSEYDVVVGYEQQKISDRIPSSTSEIEVIRPISTECAKYCSSTELCELEGLSLNLIDDGPVVAAQELEIWSSFEAGYNRSRITLLSDPNLIQGQFLVDSEGVFRQDAGRFIRSLYPETYFAPTDILGRQYNVQTKLISPERGSPAKYFINDNSMQSLVSFFRGNSSFGSPSYSHINNKESTYNSEYVTDRPDIPWADLTDQKEIEETKNEFISGFFASILQTGCMYPRFSGVIGGNLYVDATIDGGLPELLKDKGYDYMDLDKIPDLYPGDLFGYSVSIQENKVIIGSPFSAFKSENINPWSTTSQLSLGKNGGGGAVYVFEKTGNGSGVDDVNISWQCVKKLKPDSLMGQNSGVSIVSDRFGESLYLNNDIMLIGAPGHSYGNEQIITRGEFGRKYFDESFDITTRQVIDLGISGNRQNYGNQQYSYIPKAGAVYTYEYGFSDWANRRARDWKFVEKDTSPSRLENEQYGSNVYLTRPYRSDADYTIFVGNEYWNTSGIVYDKDIMLRQNPPSTRNENAWIEGRVFGDKVSENKEARIKFYNAGDPNVPVITSNDVYATKDGYIFLEVSGQDPSTQSFITHRPYIEAVIGEYKSGTPKKTGLLLYSFGTNALPSSSLPLYTRVDVSANVYNTLGMYNSAILGFASGAMPSGLSMFASGYPRSISESGLMLVTSGTTIISESLPLRIRGK